MSRLSFASTAASTSIGSTRSGPPCTTRWPTATTDYRSRLCAQPAENGAHRRLMVDAAGDGSKTSSVFSPVAALTAPFGVAPMPSICPDASWFRRRRRDREGGEFQ